MIGETIVYGCFNNDSTPINGYVRQYNILNNIYYMLNIASEQWFCI